MAAKRMAQWRMALALRREGVGHFIAPGNGVGRFLANAICPKLWIGIGDWRPPRVRPEIQTHFQPYEKDRYEADALAGLLKPMGIDAHADRLEYEVTAEEREAAAHFIKAEGVTHPARWLCWRRDRAGAEKIGCRSALARWRTGSRPKKDSRLPGWAGRARRLWCRHFGTVISTGWERRGFPTCGGDGACAAICRQRWRVVAFCGSA